jgi:hypothetical protein
VMKSERVLGPNRMLKNSALGYEPRKIRSEARDNRLRQGDLMGAGCYVEIGEHNHCKIVIHIVEDHRPEESWMAYHPMTV